MHDRPLSPHLQVYKPQLTSMLSICHRSTGVFLAFAAIFVVYWVYALAQGPESFAQAQQLLGSLLGKLVLLGVVFSTFFHLCNGIRHLVWDTGYGLDLKPAYQSGWTVIVVSLVATGVIAMRIFGGYA